VCGHTRNQDVSDNMFMHWQRPCQLSELFNLTSQTSANQPVIKLAQWYQLFLAAPCRLLYCVVNRLRSVVELHQQHDAIGGEFSLEHKSVTTNGT